MMDDPPPTWIRKPFCTLPSTFRVCATNPMSWNGATAQSLAQGEKELFELARHRLGERLADEIADVRAHVRNDVE